MPLEIPQKTQRFQHNAQLNEILGELKALLAPVQDSLPPSEPCHPVGGIVGSPRSGTTIFLQWFASLGTFAYPTNVLTRFAYAPYVGALIQRMLFEPNLDFHGDFADIQTDINFSSDLGKSNGAIACNEFQHFFRNYMPNLELEWLDNAALASTDCYGITNGLASINKAFNKPFVTKVSILQLNLEYFAKHLPFMFWIHITRNPICTMQSIFIARERYYGNHQTWWSSKPKEYEWLKDMDVHHQIAGQVYFTDKSIKDALKNIPYDRWMAVQYESFCEEPETVYGILRDKYAALGCDLPSEYTGATSFKIRNEIRLPSQDIDALQSAYEKFSSQ